MAYSMLINALYRLTPLQTKNNTQWNREIVVVIPPLPQGQFIYMQYHRNHC